MPFNTNVKMPTKKASGRWLGVIEKEVKKRSRSRLKMGRLRTTKKIRTMKVRRNGSEIGSF
jgi:hypothetical protein